MGVTGLWRLIDASGKPVPLETLEGKVLAIGILLLICQIITSNIYIHLSMNS